MSVVTVDTQSIRFSVCCAKEFFDLGRILEAQASYGQIVCKINAIKDTNATITKEIRTLFEKVDECKSNYFDIDAIIAKCKSKAKIYINLKIPTGLMCTGYETLIGEFLNADVEEILIEEPLMCEYQHFANLNALINVIMKFCGMTYVQLATHKDERESSSQMEFLKAITYESLHLSVHLEVKMVEKLEESSIMLSNGYWLKFTHGLHIFKPVEEPLIKATHFSFRYAETKETNFNVFRIPKMKKCAATYKSDV